MFADAVTVSVMSSDLRDGGHSGELAQADELLADPGFLVTADPERVVALLDLASGPAARLAAEVYRVSARLHRQAGAGMRRQLLAVDAASLGARELSARIASVPVDGEPAEEWGVDWATGSRFDPRRLRSLTGHTGVVGVVATVMLDGRAIAVTGGQDGEVRVWDLATGEQVGEPLVGHTATVEAVATAVVDGRVVAVTGSGDGEVRVWDLATGEQVSGPLKGHTATVEAVATAVVDGRAVAVTGSFGGEALVWDLATGGYACKPLQGHTGWVTAAATAVVDGRVVAVTGSGDGE
ncbi:WD40 repeat domain-containing protein, partial [Streptomyces sp. NPDC057575]